MSRFGIVGALVLSSLAIACTTKNELPEQTEPEQPERMNQKLPEQSGSELPEVDRADESLRGKVHCPTPEELNEWLDRVFDAAAISDVFDANRPN